MNVYSADQFKRRLYRPDLVREKLAGDPNGLVKAAAAKLDLNNMLASGQAPKVRLATALARVEDQGRGVGQVEWRVNGVVFGVSKPDASVHVQSLRKSLSLASGENRIEVVALTSRAMSRLCLQE
ncbi:hypothetical protein AS156_18045 [Bradyrhizobium macuxiense]|uniref:Uncharacterized protein n=1 Tax=Bradyrhizobium macuxiense TaxID=1755647 RepID=A0A109JGG8_9BRAD|nr:hypothetical protein [Bradyrhizobium macuxiense]KWV48385.1 hypothetical protein AS156_18045 [Bradyrhizobium macuxiense]